MKNRSKFMSKIVFTILILSIIGFSVANLDVFENFKGSTHTGCHSSTNPESVTGFIDLNSNVGLNLLPSQVFTISAQVRSFTEGISDSISVGFAQGVPGRGDNKKFTFAPARRDSVLIDGSGDSEILSFQVTAPSSFGNFTLVADGLEGSGASTLDWVNGTINFLIGFPSIPGAPILDNLTSTFNETETMELGETQSIQIDAYDNETSVNELLLEFNSINHTLIPSLGNTYVYQNWTPSSIGLKSYIIYAYDTDNKLSGAGGSFTVQDTILPIYSNFLKSANTTEAGETIDIQISASDLAGIKEISVEFDSNNHSMTYNGNNSWSYELRAPDQGGLFNFAVNIEDNSGNIVTIADSLQVTGEVSTGTGSPISPTMILVLGTVSGVLLISLIGIALKKKKHFF